MALASRSGNAPCPSLPREKDFKQLLCADNDGFSLHAAVRCGADDRQALEQLCRYITRPALANERVQTNATGQVVLKLKTPWHDGTTHLVLRRDTNSPVGCLCLARGRGERGRWQSCELPTPANGPTRPARGLTLPYRDRTGDPAPRGAGVGCAQGLAGPMAAG